MLAPLFPDSLVAQEVSAEPWIDIPGAVLDVYRLWRPTPLFRARRLEQALQTPAHIYFKYEGTSPVGSHKPNTAVRPGLLQQGGRHEAADDRDRGRPVGIGAGHGVRLLRPRVRRVHGQGLLPPEALPPGAHGDLRRRGAGLPDATPRRRAGRSWPPTRSPPARWASPSARPSRRPSPAPAPSTPSAASPTTSCCTRR